MGLYSSCSAVLAAGLVLHQESQLVYELITVSNFLKRKGFAQNAKWLWLMGLDRWKGALGRTCFSSCVWLRRPRGQSAPRSTSRAANCGSFKQRRLFFLLLALSLSCTAKFLGTFQAP